MAADSKHSGKERDERNSIIKIWKRVSLRFNFLSVILFSLLVLLVVKVLVSGIFLRFDPEKIKSPAFAIANEIPAAVAHNTEETERKLRNRERELNEKERELIKMEQRLLPLKREVEDKIEELNELQATLTTYSRNLAERELALRDARIEHLVKLYSSMEPARAALIMDKLPLETVVRILGNMNGKSAGGILAMMPPEKGADISQQLSKID